jgi:hypothetical protein
MKAIDIITASLRLVGVTAAGEAPGANEAIDALSVLNMMLDQWSNEKLMCNQALNVYIDDVIIPGRSSYTVGSAADISTTRPVSKMTNLFVRDKSNASNPVDIMIELIPNDKFQSISQKSTTSTYPQWANYNQSYPWGLLRLWPVPTQTLSIGFSHPIAFPDMELNSDLVLPPGYDMALRYNLAVELAADYGRPIDQLVFNKAAETKATLKRANAEDVLMTADSFLLQKGGRYNIYTDR